jgi:hypothetical protein
MKTVLLAVGFLLIGATFAQAESGDGVDTFFRKYSHTQTCVTVGGQTNCS